jgi:hypothetical protein
MRVDGATEVLVREPDGRVRKWANDGTEYHVPGRWIRRAGREARGYREA